MRTVRILFLLSITCLTAACGYRPARFAARHPVSEVADDDPIPLPDRVELDWDWYLSDVYLHRALLDTLDPRRYPVAGDVNAWDDVPRSSWYQPPGPERAVLDPPLTRDGPPVMPLALVPDATRANNYGVCVVDARGLRYELRRDGADRPEMRTAAAVIASRLVDEFGLLTPEVSVVFVGPSDFQGWTPERPRDGVSPEIRRFLSDGPPSVDGRYRVSATRWPIGVDVGVTESYGSRGDDPNDAIAHRNRRTLRALKVVGAWLAMGRISPRKTRDAYVGEPPDGFLRHYVVGLEDAMGASSIVYPNPKRGLRTDLGGSTGFNLLTLGLWPGSDSLPTQRRVRALGAFDESVDPGGYRASPPYAPIDHALPPDGYWAAKRIAAMPLRTFVAAVHEARILDPTARLHLVRGLVQRRQRIVQYWYAQVTPCEVERVLGRIIVLRDEAVSRAVTQVSDTHYRIQVLDEEGEPLTAASELSLSSAEFAVEVPEPLMSGHNRLVVLLQAEVNGKPRPRACRVHVQPIRGTLVVRGIRH